MARATATVTRAATRIAGQNGNTIEFANGELPDVQADPALLRAVRLVLTVLTISGVALLTLGSLGLTPTMRVAFESLLGVTLVAFALIVPMTLLTTPYGVRLAHAMNPAPLKRAFAVFLVLVAANMIRKVLGW